MNGVPDGIADDPQMFGRLLEPLPSRPAMLPLLAPGVPLLRPVPRLAPAVQAFDSRARAFHKQAVLIDEFSDGVKAFAGLVAAVVAGAYRIVLADEPEAFLHPPLVRRLAHRLAEFAGDAGGNTLVATHSADFVIGAVESGVPVNIVRLTYEPSATASLLSAVSMRTMMSDPLLRSTPLLSALFHRGAVICEGDADRAFYAEINARILSVRGGGAHDVLFLSAYGWQPEQKMVAPLRGMGIPAAAVVDLDVIRKPELKGLLKACGMPSPLIEGAGQARGQIAALFERAGLSPKVGISALSSAADREACDAFVGQLAEYGLFLVPVGEVERWLQHLNVVNAKPTWLPAVFDRLGADPGSPEYVSPADDDVWAFLRGIARWLNDPTRKGLPVTE